MKPDEFENQLRRQPLRKPPEEWRAEILSKARAAALPHPSRSTLHYGSWWREWLWPSPQAWAGLAAAWLVILGLNVSSGWRPTEMAKRSPKPSAEAETALAAQRRELARLLDGFAEAPPAPKLPSSGPRGASNSPPKV